MMLRLFFVTCLFGLGFSQNPDPFCAAKSCPADTTCRVVLVCATQRSCNMEAQCLANPPRFSHTGVCITGDPILTMRNGSLDDTRCGPSLPCPNGTFCNTELMDTYSTCCHSDPANTVKPGECPVNTYRNDDFCLDTCNNDGDCRGTDKCCDHGCNRDCLPIKKADACDTKVCPSGSYCQREGMPACGLPGRECHKPGDCVPCGPVCMIYCEHGNVLDPNGCPTCLCKPGPLVRSPLMSAGNTATAATATISSILVSVVISI